MAGDSEKIRNAITKIVKDVLKDEEKPCFRLYKATLKTAPNGTTCGVQLAGESETINLPYSSAINGVSTESIVWVATLYNSFSNGIVFAPIDFDFGANYTISKVIRKYNINSTANTWVYFGDSIWQVGAWLVIVSTTNNDEGSAVIGLSNNSYYYQSVNYIEGTRLSGSPSYYDSYYPTVALYNGKLYMKYPKSDVNFNITVVGV